MVEKSIKREDDLCEKCSITDKISIKEIHETFWRCRDFELSHLWQRSIFLSAFLVLCFTGYGTLVLKLLDVEYFKYVNLLAFAVCIVGILFSCLWIMMGKGSKAWYERYEQAIGAFEKNSKYVNPSVAHIGGFRYEQIKGYDSPELSKNIFKGEGGAFSPSKINIAIGQITMVIWALALLFHSSIIIWGVKVISLLADFEYVILILGFVLLIIFFCLIFIPKSHWLHSPTLNHE